MKSMAVERFTLSIGSPAALMVRKQTSRAAMMRQDVGLGHKHAGRGDQHQEGRNEDGEIDALHGWKGLSEKGQLVSSGRALSCWDRRRARTASSTRSKARHHPY
jgi:hypothetical protein